jgi:hypothetical protein
VRRLKVVVLISATSVGIVGAALLAGPVVDRFRDARDAAQWEAQTPLLVAAVERVQMPSSFERVDCDIEAGMVGYCWHTSLAPDEALPDLEQALSAAGLQPVTSDCDSINGVVLGCWAQGIPYERDPEALVERVVAATAHWEKAPLRGSPGERSIVRVTALVEAPAA